MFAALRKTGLTAILPGELHEAVVINLGGGATDQLATLCFARLLKDYYHQAGMAPQLVLNLHRQIWPKRSLHLRDAGDRVFMRELSSRRRSYDGSGRRLQQMGFELSAFDLDWSCCRFAMMPLPLQAAYRAAGRYVTHADRTALLGGKMAPRPPLLFNGDTGLDVLESSAVAGFIGKLRMSAELSADNERKLRQIENSTNPVCMHVRRGDYILHSGGGVLPAEYFHNALRILAATARWEQMSVFVFSDDLAWARQKINFQIPPTRITVEFVDINGISDPIPELWLMRACRAFIISTGRFGMLASRLSTHSHKILIAPRAPKLSAECRAYSIGAAPSPSP